MRCFVSIDIPEEVRAKIKKIQDALPEFIGKKTELENLHLTLKFLGEIDKEQVEEIKERLRRVKFDKFETKIDGIGYFSPTFIKIIWLHLTGCDELQKQVDNALKDLFEQEHRFMSHLTIARVKNIKDKNVFLEKLKRIKIPEIRFGVDNFRLKKSVLNHNGPKYEALEEYKLD